MHRMHTEIYLSTIADFSFFETYFLGAQTSTTVSRMLWLPPCFMKMIKCVTIIQTNQNCSLHCQATPRFIWLQCYHDKNNYGNKEFSEEEGESSQESQDFATESEGSQFKPHWALGLAQGPNLNTRFPVTFGSKLDKSE